MANEDDLDDDAYCEDEDEFVDELEDNSPPTTKLERRRRIEQMAEDKKLMEELSDFDF